VSKKRGKRAMPRKQKQKGGRTGKLPGDSGKKRTLSTEKAGWLLCDGQRKIR
jgi:hypothetical protein